MLSWTNMYVCIFFEYVLDIYLFFCGQVYASPSRRKMDTKGEGEEMTYPHICFMVDNFDEVRCAPFMCTLLIDTWFYSRWLNK